MKTIAMKTIGKKAAESACVLAALAAILVLGGDPAPEMSAAAEFATRAAAAGVFAGSLLALSRLTRKEVGHA